jgi:hypothetical protein
LFGNIVKVVATREMRLVRPVTYIMELTNAQRIFVGIYREKENIWT